MDDETRNLIRDLQSTDDKVRLNALQAVLGLTDTKVDWAYEVWDEMIEKISHENSYQRSIGIMVLCNLAKSDHENRLGAVLDKLLAHTKDEKFITSRQCLQNIWKAGVMNEQIVRLWWNILKSVTVNAHRKNITTCCDWISSKPSGGYLMRLEIHLC